MHLRHIATLTLLAAGCATLPALADTTVFSQPTCHCGAWNSQSSPVPTGTAYDDFKLGFAAHIDGVQFVGVPTAIPDGITGFTVTFYSDASGHPGSALDSFNISGDAGESDTGHTGPYGEEYAYSAPISFDASANTEYWISIVATMPYPPQFGLAWGNNGDLTSYELYQGVSTRHNSDLAFSLTAATPEPSSLLLLGTGGGALAGAVRRRFRRA